MQDGGQFGFQDGCRDYQNIKNNRFSTVFAPRSALLGPRLFDHEIVNAADSFNYKFCTPTKQQKWLNVNQCA